VPSAKISPDGRYVVFHSFAENLVADDTNGVIDVFVRDLKTKITSRVSVDSNNIQGSGWSLSPDISANGRFVVFTSYSSLTLKDTNGSTDVYLHDRSTHQTSLISVDLNGSQAAGLSSENGASISADGRYVAFDSEANNLVAGETFLSSDVFVRDRNLFTVSADLQITTLTDLQITTTANPASLAVNGLGNYTYTISNKGVYPAYTAITHLVSNGNIVSFTISPNQGKCNSYATISLCQLGRVEPGGSVSLAITAKALRSPLRQQLTLSSGGRDDPNKINNYITLSTPVTP
jgi:Tol biopolymer transport system component